MESIHRTRRPRDFMTSQYEQRQLKVVTTQYGHLILYFVVRPKLENLLFISSLFHQRKTVNKYFKLQSYTEFLKSTILWNATYTWSTHIYIKYTRKLANRLTHIDRPNSMRIAYAPVYTYILIVGLTFDCAKYRTLYYVTRYVRYLLNVYDPTGLFCKWKDLLTIVQWNGT